MNGVLVEYAFDWLVSLVNTEVNSVGEVIVTIVVVDDSIVGFVSAFISEVIGIYEVAVVEVSNISVICVDVSLDSSVDSLTVVSLFILISVVVTPVNDSKGEEP